MIYFRIHAVFLIYLFSHACNFPIMNIHVLYVFSLFKYYLRNISLICFLTDIISDLYVLCFTYFPIPVVSDLFK